MCIYNKKLTHTKNTNLPICQFIPITIRFCIEVENTHAHTHIHVYVFEGKDNN